MSGAFLRFFANQDGVESIAGLGRCRIFMAMPMPKPISAGTTQPKPEAYSGR